MNHIEMFNHVQDYKNNFSTEVRLMMQTINNHTDLGKMLNDLNVLVAFANQKIQDTGALSQLPSNDYDHFLLEEASE